MIIMGLLPLLLATGNAVPPLDMAGWQACRMLVAESLNIPKRTLDHKCQKLEVN